MPGLSRREWLKAGGAGAVMLAAGGAARGAAEKAPAAAEKGAGKERWRLSLNTSTIRPASLEDKIKVAAAAKYDAIELWASELANHEKSGKSVEDLGKRIKDAGLEVANIIGIWNSMPQDDAAKAKLIEDARRALGHAAKVGARHIAAIPAPDRPDFDVLWGARQYAGLVDLGKEFGVAVSIEFVSFLKGIHTLGQAVAMVMESGRPGGSIVSDTFHMHNGGSAWSGLKFLDGSIFAVWHFNDVPREPEPGRMKDSDRIYPGDGILPLKEALRDLWKSGFRGPLSLEMFNKAEYAKDPAEVAKIGIEKMRAVIAASGVGV